MKKQSLSTVSVIVPNYNHAPFLEQRISSILAQTYADFELLILDDCSTDNSRAIIDQYESHPKVSHVVYNQENAGSTFKQWQKGIALAEGEWIWIAESDDWAEPNFLEELMRAVSDQPRVNLAFAQLYLVYEDSAYVSARYEGRALQEKIDGEAFVKEKMLPFLAIWNASQAIFRKSAYYNVSSEYLKYKFCGDWVFWSEVSLQGEVLISGKFLSYFRKHGLDVTSKATKSGLRFKEELNVLIYLNKLLDGFVKQKDIFAFHFSNFYSVRRLLPKASYHEIHSLYKKQLSVQKRMGKQARAILGELWRR